MKTEKQIINQAISELRGDVSIGDVVAHVSHPLTHRLVDIVGGIGICELLDGSINKFPIYELFDANKVKNRAIELKFEDALIPNRNN